MSRRVRIGRIALATLLATMLVIPMPAFALDSGVYEHIWQAQTLFSGAAGTSDQAVIEGRVEMTRDADAFEGIVLFSDLLGVETGSQVTSHESHIELALTGATQQGGEAVGGTFTGEAVLTLRGADTIAEAVYELILGVEAESVTYEVSGHWGGTIDGDIIEGEILFERIEGPDRPASGPEYFNRANAANPDMLGDAQRFVVDLSSEPGSGGTTGDGTDTNSDSEEDSTGDADDGSSAASDEGTSVFGYILKGLTGGAEKPLMPVPDELAAPARALAEASPAGATPLPDNAVAIDLDLSGSYLDAKNRAAGLVDAGGPTGALGQSLAADAEKMRLAVPGIPAVPVDKDAAAVWGERAQALLDEQADVDGAATLMDQITLVRPGAGPDTVSALRTWYHVAVATGAAREFGSVASDSLTLAEKVAYTEIAPGSGADAVLAAANSSNAPSLATVVTEFEEGEGSVTQEELSRYLFLRRLLGGLPHIVVSAHGTEGEGGLGLTYTTLDGPRRVAPETWVPYTRADGAEYWLAGENGETALTDGSLHGWAFSLNRAALVDAGHVGVWLTVYPTG